MGKALQLIETSVQLRINTGPYLQDGNGELTIWQGHIMYVSVVTEFFHLESPNTLPRSTIIGISGFPSAMEALTPQ